MEQVMLVWVRKMELATVQVLVTVQEAEVVIKEAEESKSSLKLNNKDDNHCRPF
jgi:hypothetical protein